MTGKTVLVTGANGFIAAHIVQQLLEKSYTVVGTVRSLAKGTELTTLHPTWVTPSLTFAAIPDISKPGCWDEVLKAHKFDYVLHTASPYSASVGGQPLLSAAIDGTKSILQAITAHAPTVQRVIVTSSFGSIVDITKGTWPGKVYTEDDWNATSYEAAAAPDAEWVTTYLASKALAEKAAWSIAKESSPLPSFTLTTLCPPMVFGPPINHIPGTPLSKSSESTQIIHNLLTAGTATAPPPTGFWLWIDVRDIAAAHILAIERPAADVAGERFLVASGNYSFQEMCDILREKLSPEEAANVPIGEPGKGIPESGVYAADTKKSIEKLGMTYRSLTESVVDAAKVVGELQKKVKA